MPSFCTRLASICSTRRCSTDMPACARLHQTAIWRIRPCNGIHHQRGRRPTFFQKSRTNDFRQSIGELALAVLVKSFQTLCGDLLWGQERYPPPVWWGNTLLPRPLTSHGTLRHIWNNALLCWAQPWWLLASLKQCSFVATLEHSSAPSEATRNVALSVKCLSLSLCKVSKPLSLCLTSSGDMLTCSWPYFDFVIDWELATNHVWKASEQCNIRFEVNFLSTCNGLFGW